MWPNNKDIPLFVGVPVIMTHRVYSLINFGTMTHTVALYTVIGPPFSLCFYAFVTFPPR